MGNSHSHERNAQDDKYFRKKISNSEEDVYWDYYEEEDGCCIGCTPCCRRNSSDSECYKKISKIERPASFTFEPIINADTTSPEHLNFTRKRVSPIAPRYPYNVHSRPLQYVEEVERRRSEALNSPGFTVCPQHEKIFPQPPAWRGRIPPFPLTLPGERSNNNHESYILCANSQKDRESWKAEFNRLIWKPYGGGIFGLRLEETMQYEDRLFNRSFDGKDKPTRVAPIIVENCVDFIRQNGLKEEGLFRLPGQANDVKDLQDKFDTGNRPQFGKLTDIHTVTSLLKSYLRELPEPAVPFSMYPNLVEAVRDVKANQSPTPGTGSPVKENETKRKARVRIKEILGKLPKHNYNLLRYICRFLDEVQVFSEDNKMDISNLALMFGPNLIRPEKSDPSTLMADSTYVQYIMAEFISNHKFFFPEFKRNRPSSSIPDVVPESRKSVRPMHAPPPPPPVKHTDTVNSGTTTSTEGFNTMTTVTSPPGTLPHHVTDDSGTGSLGPTPENTSKRIIMDTTGKIKKNPYALNHRKSADVIAEEPSELDRPFTTRSTSEVLMRPKLQKQGISSPAGISRKSTYDNVTPSSGSAESPNRVASGICYEYSGDWARKNESGPTSEDSVTSRPQSTNASDYSALFNASRSSAIAVAGSSISGKTVNSDVDALSSTGQPQSKFTFTDGSSSKVVRPRPRRKPKPNELKKLRKSAISDEESNTESLPVSDDRTDLTSVSSRHNSQSSLFSSEVAPDKPPRRKNSSSQPPTNRVKQFETDSMSRSSFATSNISQTLSNHDLQLQIQELKGELEKQRREYEKRSQLLEEHFVNQIRSLSVNNSVANQSTLSNSINESSHDTSQRYSFMSVSSLDSRLQAHGEQFTLLEKRIVDLERNNTEEAKRHKMTQIQLHNAERGRQAAEDRNRELQEEMKTFFNTFGEMFSESERNKSSSSASKRA